MTGLEALNEFKGNNNTKLVGRAMGKQHYIDCLKTMEKHLQALEIIKRFIWVEDDKLMCGRYGDVEIELDESDFEDEEEFDLLKEVLK